MIAASNDILPECLSNAKEVSVLESVILDLPIVGLVFLLFLVTILVIVEFPVDFLLFYLLLVLLTDALGTAAAEAAAEELRATV